MSDLLNQPSVRRVQTALAALGSKARVIALEETARSAEDAAASIGCPLGAIVKSLVFVVGKQPVMALIAGDHRCRTQGLPKALRLAGKCNRADAHEVRAATGYAIGGVAPVGHPKPLPIAIDPSLGRFQAIYAAAGHPHCVFGTTLDELTRLANAVCRPEIAEPLA